jgi:uncharacterized phage infection (PIP) family protein YhgE
MADDVIQLKVDVGVLKTQVLTLIELSQKMDKVIEKLTEQQEKYTTQVYTDMENRRIEKNAEIKEIHDRIDTVIDKVQITELRIMAEVKQLRAELIEKSDANSGKVDNLSQWKWMIAGGMLVGIWVLNRAIEIYTNFK